MSAIAPLMQFIPVEDYNEDERHSEIRPLARIYEAHGCGARCQVTLRS